MTVLGVTCCSWAQTVLSFSASVPLRLSFSTSLSLSLCLCLSVSALARLLSLHLHEASPSTSHDAHHDAHSPKLAELLRSGEPQVARRPGLGESLCEGTPPPLPAVPRCSIAASIGGVFERPLANRRAVVLRRPDTPWRAGARGRVSRSAAGDGPSSFTNLHRGFSRPGLPVSFCSVVVFLENVTRGRRGGADFLA
ncbi:hypothetical protein EV126DRAFT_105267 [Verticillium dahliae]|nr:hypothetical protein EV126DRAFT_105267 [Verticillium dahliae]